MGRPFKFLPVFAPVSAGLLVIWILFPRPVLADCTTSANTTECTGTTNLGTTPIGNGSNGPDNRRVTVAAGASVTAGNANAISLRDNAVITIGDGAIVRSNGASGGTSGLWGAGKNTIEFRSNGTLTVGVGATVSAIGSSTNAEAVNLIGAGNTVINHGTISAINTAAIWFEDQVVGAANTIDNYGIIRRGSGSDQSVTDNTIGSQRGGDVNFINRTGAIVYGGLSFAGGNDTLTLFPSSVVTGGFDGGGGTNTLTLAGDPGTSDTLVGNISNFQKLTKAGGGTWTLTGTVGTNSGAPLAVGVQQGTLVLTGNNASFNGSVVVDPAGILEARAQSLPPAITDNGLVRFAQPDNGTYAGIISGTGAVTKTEAGVLTLTGANNYQGGTTIQGGTIAVDANNRLGNSSGSITFDGGALQLTSSFNLSAGRAISITANNGTIVTDPAVTTSINQAITGAGALTKAGAGTLQLGGASTYAGGTTISGGTLELGRGDTTGSIIGDVVNNGTLAFNRSNSYTFAGAISGSGDVNQIGAGTTILTGDNDYAGETTVSNGWLYIDGDQSAATGDTTAQAGTRLGGNGIIGGNVTIADGATLAPGAVPQTPATLTVNGDLMLNQTSNLFFNMVEANVAGGQLNDLVNVGGDLVLDGVINIADQDQTLGPGVYRVFNYSGELTNRGLTIGSFMTAPATPQVPPVVTRSLDGFSVQTSIAGQVNLVNTGGLALTYWDVDPKNNDAIDGGSGFWQASVVGDDNWTGPGGDFNAPWVDGSFAIFMATAGTVEVDDSLGEVTASGMQFASDGYVVFGDQITLTPDTAGGPSTIRVGDGTDASESMTATINSVLAGDAVLVKEDLGTLVLGGANTYAGGTRIQGGILQVSSDANLGLLTSGLTIANGSALSTTASFTSGRTVTLEGSGGAFIVADGTELTLTGPITQNTAGAILGKTGEGTLVIAGTGSYTGPTLIGAGTVQIGDGGTTGSILGAVANSGTLAFDRSNSYTFGGLIFGSGSVEQIGSGTTILTANNLYSGGTTISDGTLQLGNGGTTGAIAGDVTNDGTLVFNRSNTYTFAGVVSGTGDLVQAGGGLTILTGDNSYAGETTVSDGILFVNGDQTQATGLTSVKSGARLSGNGIIGGNVIVESGAEFGPAGSQPLTPATLTINGDLTLNDGSTLFYNVLEAGVVGGQNNDLTIVHGDLILDGTIDIVEQDQTLGPGVYRIINYDGELTNNGLEIGDITTDPTVGGRPLGGNFFVQTAIAGQVNLVNTAGLTLTYWDGDGPGTTKNNNVIEGGDGTWRAQGALSTDNWTDPAGTANAPWTAAGFAIFSGTAGVVTVALDNGPVLASGMQFTTDGYSIVGAPIQLSGPATIRVGDGTATGAGVTATIDTVLTGGDSLTKTDLGTLILTGANTYSSGTTVNGGVLRISDDGNLGDSAGDLALNSGTLNTTGTFTTARAVTIGAAGGTFETDAGTALTVTAAVTGAGALTKSGDGALILSADNSYGGGTTIAAGTLQVGAGGTTGSIIGNVTNDGALVFDRGNEYLFAGTVSGSGSLEQAGSGTTILTADNTYSGGTTISNGRLQLGNGGTTGSIVGDVVDDGILTFNRSNTYTFDGTISGGGALEQIGGGTTILTADNGYLGGTTITNGTLQLGEGGATGSIVGDVANDGALVFNRSNTYVFDGAITGTGSVSQIGAGTTILTADNSYSGGTTISDGTLQLGEGGATGSIVGDITNNGVLIVDRSNELALDGHIIGNGSLIQQGPGTTILTGNSTYSGGTTISEGTLQLGDGGNTGSIVGDIANNGTLAIDRADLLPVVGLISGTGNVVQQGTGTTVLLADNTYAGPTDVLSGALYVNGNQGTATGLTSVAPGATLGGKGVIGGDVEVAAGATLSPGDFGVAPGTLTINGDLELGGTSTLTYNFGQADVVGGSLNDLTVVQGDLVLDGTLNVQTTEGGSFDPGVYRVISYAGGLTDNGLEIGTIPSPDFLLQMSVPNQVNLINTAGMTFNYWDGADGATDIGVINGGDGLWQNSSGNTNWTNEQGNPNAEYDDAAFAIFMAEGGTVTIDDGLGDVVAAGMQFASDGYVIEGAELNLVDSSATPGRSIIRVGDGTDLGAAFTAEIDSVIAGDTTLAKSDLGTLVLGGANTYTGGTAITGGAIEISADNNLGDSAGALSIDGGALRTTDTFASDRDVTLGANGGTFDTLVGAAFTLESPVAGEGALTKDGDGTLVLMADNTYAGGTTIAQGTLQLGSGGMTGSITGDVANDGNLTFDRSDTYTFEGLISGFGSVTQAGTGATILTADNTYSGGTTISAGTLQLGNGGTSGSIAGDVVNDGALVFDRSDVLTFSGDISGTGSVSQVGTGTTVLTGANSYGGITTVASGTLRAGATNTFSPNSVHAVSAGGTLDLDGFDQTVAGVTNAGMIFINGGPGATLTVNGDYAGADGLLAFNTFLGNDDAPSDRLVISAGEATGVTRLRIANIAGLGALTTGSGILVVDAINGATTAPGAFELDGPVVAGPYEYTLFRGNGNPDAWYLRSTLDCSAPDAPFPPCVGPEPPNNRPEVSLYVAIPSLALDYGNALLDTLDERMGGQRAFWRTNPGSNDHDDLAWGRILGVAGSEDGGERGIYGNGGASYDYDIFAVQTGMDVYRAEHSDGSFDNAGLYFAYGHASADVTHFDGQDAGTDRLNGPTLGGYWTHFGASGWYLDAVVQSTWYDINASGRLPAMDTDAFGFGASLEGGYPIKLDNGIVLEPQLQFIYQAIDIDNGRDIGAEVRFSDVESLVGRLGVRLSRAWEFEAEAGTAAPRRAVAWARLSLLNEFLAQPVTEFSSEDGYVPFEDDEKGAGLKIDVGIDAEVRENISTYGSFEFQHKFGGEDDYAVGGEVGLNVKF